MGNCNLIGDYGIGAFIKICPNVEHLDLTNLDSLTEFGLKGFVSDLKSLKFIDLSGVSTVTRALVEEWTQQRPALLLKQFKINKVDPKDNGLRVPRRIKEDDDGKKKKKK